MPADLPQYGAPPAPPVPGSTKTSQLIYEVVDLLTVSVHTGVLLSFLDLLFC